MAKQQPELGTKSPYRLRLGHNIDRFRGVNREADPAAIREDEFQDAQNIRITASGKVVPRGGQSKVNASAMVGCVDGLIDDEHIPGTKMYFGRDLAAAAVDNEYIATFIEEQYPTTLAAGPLPSIGSPWAVHAGKLFCLVESGSDSVFKSLSASTSPAIQTPATEFTATGIQNFVDGMSYGGELYLLRNVAGAEAKMYKWDGVSLTLDDSSGVTPVTTRNGWSIAILGDDLYYIVPTTTGGRVRKKSGGTWSTFCTFNNNQPIHLTAYNSRLFVTNNVGQSGGFPFTIWEVTAAGLTSLYTDTAIQSDCLYMIEFNDYLYFLHDNGLGRYDGTTFEGSHAGVSGTLLGISAAGNLVSISSGQVDVSNGTDTATFTPETPTFTLPMPDVRHKRSFVL